MTRRFSPVVTANRVATGRATVAFVSTVGAESTGVALGFADTRGRAGFELRSAEAELRFELLDARDVSGFDRGRGTTDTWTGNDGFDALLEVAELAGDRVELTATGAGALTFGTPGTLDLCSLGGLRSCDSRPSSFMGALHLRQCIVVTRPRTRLFHSPSGILNFALHALHSTLNDIGSLERGRPSTWFYKRP